MAGAHSIYGWVAYIHQYYQYNIQQADTEKMFLCSSLWPYFSGIVPNNKCWSWIFWLDTSNQYDHHIVINRIKRFLCVWIMCAPLQMTTLQQNFDRKQPFFGVKLTKNFSSTNYHTRPSNEAVCVRTKSTSVCYTSTIHATEECQFQTWNIITETSCLTKY